MGKEIFHVIFIMEIKGNQYNLKKSYKNGYIVGLGGDYSKK